jgi:hypothetical protein
MGSCVLRETTRVVRRLLRAFPSCKAETETQAHLFLRVALLRIVLCQKCRLLRSCACRARWRTSRCA